MASPSMIAGGSSVDMANGSRVIEGLGITHEMKGGLHCAKCVAVSDCSQGPTCWNPES